MKKALLFAFTIFVVMNMAQCGLAYYGLENIPYNIILQGNSIEEIVCQSALIFHGNGYWEDAEVNGVSDSENPPTIPCAEFIHADNEYRWRPIIDIDNGVITNWEKGFTAQVHYKVCDDGIYTVTDKDGNIIVEHEGYVPSIMCPEDEGYGDYIIMNIDENGFIQGWEKELISRIIKKYED